ncbi:MAG: hypothetical protein JWM47_2285 [Acidimicrobiales bacterium]|nr:hypothetical protein [Acidimicrobiales bacterium]
MGEHDGSRSTPMGRGAKLLALSLGGGAALTLMGATAAHAQDAGSQGGNATSTGNQSSNDQGQTLLVTPGSDPTVADIHGSVGNGGAAASNSGGNNAVNTSADPDDAVTQTVKSGNATSAGNQSQNKLNQSATSSATGGGLTVIDQGARIRSWGGALADTGFNSGDGTVSGNADAWGNRSWSSIDQSALVNDASGTTRIVDQHARITNLGLALAETGQNVGDGITTGNASAGGNDAKSATAQSGLVTGDVIGNATVEQGSRTRNRGLGVANTGFNQTTGDDSTNLAQVFQNGVLAEEDP